MSAAATALRAAGLRAAALALALLAPAGAAAQGTESVHDALCRLISGSAAEAGLPVDFLTRLIWQESSFRPHVTSRAGAQGVAQFMPGTAAERGLADPFDPEQAIPAAAALLRDLRTRFGNLGLAAAAYNGGPARLSAWLAGTGGLPAETRAYVAAITGRTAEDWAAEREDVDKAPTPPAAGGGAAGAGVPTCPETLVALRVRPTAPAIAESPFAPWGVQLAGNFSKARALASFARVQRAHAKLLAEAAPMVIGTRLRHRGTRAFYRVRVPAQTREAASRLCDRLRAAGGACIVLRS